MSLVDKTSKGVEWFTPLRVLTPVRAFFASLPGSGRIDLDPATDEINPCKARRFYTERDNGLKRKWACNVWLNPPYGGGFAEWTAKIKHELDRASGSHPCRIVALLPSNRFETGYAQTNLFNDHLAAIVFVRKRLSFIDRHGRRIMDKHGKPKSGNPYGSLLWIYDAKHRTYCYDQAVKAFGHLGVVMLADTFAKPDNA